LTKISDAVKQSIDTNSDQLTTDAFSVSVSDFDYRNSDIYRANSPTESDTLYSEQVNRLLRQLTGDKPPNATIDASHEAAVIFYVQSEKEDTVIDNIINELKDSAKSQFTKTRAAVLACRLCELCTEELEEMLRAQETGSLTAQVQDLFQRDDMRHIHTIAFMSGFRVFRDRTASGLAVPQGRFADLPTWLFLNPTHPNKGDPQYQTMNL
jgi:hypothetical protein